MGERAGQGEFLKALASCRKVNADTSVFIYHLQGEDRYRPLVEPLFRQAAEGQLEVVLSAVAFLELLVQPMRRGALPEMETVVELAQRHPGIKVVSVDGGVILAAASIRARTNLKVPDAIVLATGVVERCDATIGNDRSCQGATGRLKGQQIVGQEMPLFAPPYLCLGDYVTAP